MKTTLYTVLCVAIRLGAVLMAIDVLVAVPAYLWGSPDRTLAVIALGFAGLDLLLAAVLWLWPGLLARWAARRPDGQVLESVLGADEIQHVAFATMGAWLFISGLASTVPQAFAIWRVHDLRLTYAGIQPSAGQWNGLIRAAVVLVAGAVLMLGSRGLVGLLHRLRGFPQAGSASLDDDIGMTPRG